MKTLSTLHMLALKILSGSTSKVHSRDSRILGIVNGSRIVEVLDAE